MMKAIGKNKIAVIAAAGIGSRCLPISEFIPKEMFPVNNKPIIHYLIEEAMRWGATEIIVALSNKKRMIKKYLTKTFLKTKITFVTQTSPRGLLDLINQIGLKKDWILNLILGDELIVFNKELLAKVNKLNNNNLILVQSKMPNRQKNNYGMFKVQNQQIKKFKEKPRSHLNEYTHAIIGRYYFQTNDILNLKLQSETKLSTLITELIKMQRLKILEVENNRFDVSTPGGIAQANNFFKDELDNF